MSSIEELEHLKIPVEEIKLATNNFSVENFLGQGGFGPVYRGELIRSEKCYNVAVKRLESKHGQGQREFLMEIVMLASCKHENLVSLVGFCDESDEKILVYELEIHGSLDKYLSSKDLTWLQRLQICIGAARGLSYLHSGAGAQHKILHRDIKSSNILLDGNWEAKVSDFGLSKVGPANQQFTFLVSNVCGTYGYVDPQYMKTGILTKESDVYSFGVLLFEVLCGRPACILSYEDERRFLAPLAQLCYEQDRLDEIINPNLREQMTPESLSVFSAAAYKCLKENRRERPTMRQILDELATALELQRTALELGAGANLKMTERCGGPGGDSWSFLLPTNHKLKKIFIGYDIWIQSLIFTTEDSDGISHNSREFGLRHRRFHEIDFDAQEKIIGISGTVANMNLVFVGSLSFITNKKTHGPVGGDFYGPIGGNVATSFSISCQGCALAGFYGRAGDYIDSIGLYLKPATENEELMRKVHV